MGMLEAAFVTKLGPSRRSNQGRPNGRDWSCACPALSRPAKLRPFLFERALLTRRSDEAGNPRGNAGRGIRERTRASCSGFEELPSSRTEIRFTDRT